MPTDTSITLTHALLAAHAGSQVLCLAADDRIIGAPVKLWGERPAGYMRQTQGRRPHAVRLARAKGAPAANVAISFTGSGAMLRMERDPDEEPDSDDDPPSSDDDYSTAAATVGIVSIEGPLEETSQPRDPCGAQLMGYDTIAESYCAAHADPAVDAILMRFRSPGGVVNGVFSCAARCEAAKLASGKRVVGIVDNNCESAAYLLASALCDVILIPVDGFAGSIGCRGGSYNTSAALKAEGVLYTAWGWPPKAEGDDVSGKLAGHPDLPPSALGDARGDAHVTDAGEMFGALVERTRGARGLDMATILALKADSLRGPAAVAAHLADDIGTREDALALAMSHAVARRMMAAPAVAMPPAPAPPPAAPPSTSTAPAASASRTPTGAPRMSLASLAALAGLGGDATAPAIEAALVPLVTLGRATMKAAATADPEDARAWIKQATAAHAEAPKLRNDLAEAKATAETAERFKLGDDLVAKGYDPGRVFVYQAREVNGATVRERVGLVAEFAAPTTANGEEIGMTLGTLRGFVRREPARPEAPAARSPWEPKKPTGAALATDPDVQNAAQRAGVSPEAMAAGRAGIDAALNGGGA